MFQFQDIPFQFPSFHGPNPANQSEDLEYYKVLGLPKSASDSDIKKAYRSLARENHPDKGGCAEKFKEISEAYEILSDNDQRQHYDRFGKVENNGEHHNPFDIFQQMFSSQGPSVPRKAPDITHVLQLSLEDVCKGKVCKMSVKCSQTCSSCDGIGGKSFEKCSTCTGSGICTTHKQIGPNIMQRVTGPCEKCSGSGNRIEEKNKCKDCKGGRRQNPVVIEVKIPPGVENGARFLFPGKGDQIPGTDPSDIIFVVNVKSHPVYRRKDQDLYVSHEIELYDALVGKVCEVSDHPRLKNHILIKTPNEKIIKQGSKICVKGLGILEHSDLYIEFKIKFPDTLPTTSLDSILDEKKKVYKSSKCEYEISQFV